MHIKMFLAMMLKTSSFEDHFIWYPAQNQGGWCEEKICKHYKMCSFYIFYDILRI